MPVHFHRAQEYLKHLFDRFSLDELMNYSTLCCAKDGVSRGA